MHRHSDSSGPVSAYLAAMEDPANEIAGIVHILTQATPTKQKAAIERYFTPDASFTHPFCASKSWIVDIPGFGTLSSRWAMIQIYQWYKLLSPAISLDVECVTFNEDHLKLYVDVHQHFRLWFVPFYDADVRLTVVLDLKEGNENGPKSASSSQDLLARSEQPYSYASVANPRRENGLKKTFYYISAQNDLYQTSEWIKFLIPWNIGYILVVAWQLLATFFCIIGACLFFPQTWWKEKSIADLPRKI